ncbi:MAG: response regulator transcription factor [Acidobacteriia bacterium]|nr:response regulator transcription factor [Terriglobia bacterium]
MKLCAESPPAKLVVFTDEPLPALGVSHLLSASEQFEYIPAEPQIAELLPLIQTVQPDIILVDVTPEMTIALLARIREKAPGARLILWGRSFSDELLTQAQEFGISGVISRTCSKEIFLEKLQRAAAGDNVGEAEAPGRFTKVDLTHRESQLVTLLSQGLKNKEIATCLGITEATVKAYLSRLFQKVGARDRFELALFGLKNTYCGQAWWDGPNGFVMEPEQERAAPLVRSLVLVEPARRQGYPQARLA